MPADQQGPPGGAAPFVPATVDLAHLADAARGCTGCELYRDAAATVFGQGPQHAALMLVGEQPGDAEDRAGLPFVGPAGRLLDRALADAGIDRGAAYLTNAVKHFRFKSTASGNRRIHLRPGAAHVAACRPWLAAEIHAVTPRLIVLLGATAAGSVLGPGFRVTEHRGQLLDWPPATGPFADDDGPVAAATATVHPSSVLRSEDPGRAAAYRAFVHDLGVAARWLDDHPSG